MSIKINIKNRLRYDFRFIQNRVSEKIDFRPRIRYLLGVDFRLNKKSLYLVAYNEFFFNTYKTRTATYAENWAFAGIGFSVSKKVKIETGPLMISWVRNLEKDWLHQCFMQVTLSYQLDLKHKSNK